MKDNSSTYIGKIGEIINYVDHPIISIKDVIIKYLGKQAQHATEQHVAMGDVYTFEISAVNGKSHNIDWSAGTGDLPGPSYWKTNNACYELQINIIEGNWHMEEKLVLNKKFAFNFPKWAIDLCK